MSVDRVVDTPDTCRRCPREAKRDGLCMGCFREYHQGVVTDGGHDLPAPAGVATPDSITVSDWCTDLSVGDQVTIDTPVGLVTSRVLGFSEWPEYHGDPVIKKPSALSDHGDLEDVDLIVLRETDLVENGGGEEIATDGGIIEATATPTTDREGIDIPLTRVTCPSCERRNVTEKEVNLCICGRWFKVDNAQELADTAADVEEVNA